MRPASDSARRTWPSGVSASVRASWNPAAASNTSKPGGTRGSAPFGTGTTRGGFVADGVA
jgi:hypothetical protein